MPDFHPLERAVLPHLQDEGAVEELQDATGLDRVEVVRALQWLSNKDLVSIEDVEEHVVQQGKNFTETLPEHELYDRLRSEERVPISSLERPEEKASIGRLKKRGTATVEDGTLVLAREDDFSEIEDVLATLPLEQDEVELADDVLHDLETRGVVEIRKRPTQRYTVTEQGKEYQGEEFDTDVIDTVTHGLLKEKAWKDKEFRAFDVEADVPLKDRGKRHFVEEAKEFVRDVWTEMGFQQMTGDIVQSAFWNLDTLFVPQDHPARDMQDTFYVDEEGDLDFQAIYDRVKAVHEDGGDTESSGWRYDFSEEEARKLLLRTHTTVLSAKTLMELDREDLPAKFFSLGRNYRNESLDWQHLFEFYQVEGIVVDPDATFSNLIGYLKEFFKKMGFPDARVRPGYFPYTEPSAEVDVYHPEQEEWVELGGAGVFRPEVTKPLLGFECPVLAWGLGLERIITDYYGIEDLRRIYANDIEDLRTVKKFIR